MLEHNLSDWHFRFDRAKRRFGACHYHSKTISLSRELTLRNSLEQVKDTLLHEIAHALAPGDGHGTKWQAVCHEIGATPRRCFMTHEVQTATAKYLLVCDCCGRKAPRYRKSHRAIACKSCCKRYNGGRYSDSYRLRWVTVNQANRV